MVNPHLIAKQYIRARMSTLSVIIDKRTKGSITPADITWVGFTAHIPIAFFLAYGQLALSAVLLIVFGLFDALDGALARTQGKASVLGMFIDASTDRLKEVLIYAGLAVYFIREEPAWGAVLAVLACGLSLSVSYVKAKGEAALAVKNPDMDHQKLNRIFGDGIGSFEVRIFLIIVSCVLLVPEYGLFIIVGLTVYTLVTRFIKIVSALR